MAAVAGNVQERSQHVVPVDWKIFHIWVIWWAHWVVSGGVVEVTASLCLSVMLSCHVAFCSLQSIVKHGAKGAQRCYLFISCLLYCDNEWHCLGSQQGIWVPIICP